MIHCICYLIYDTWYLILDSDNHISYLTPCYWNLDTWILSLATCYLLTVTFLLILTGTCFFILFIWYLLLLAKRLYPFAPVARLALVFITYLIMRYTRFLKICFYFCWEALRLGPLKIRKIQNFLEWHLMTIHNLMRFSKKISNFLKIWFLGRLKKNQFIFRFLIWLFVYKRVKLLHCDNFYLILVPRPSHKDWKNGHYDIFLLPL